MLNNLLAYSGIRCVVGSRTVVSSRLPNLLANRASRAVAAAVLLLSCAGLLPAATTVLFDPATPSTGPYPSDSWTTPDFFQKTNLRVNLPVPSCATQYTACQEGGLLDQLDGFGLRARLQVRFSGPVTTSTLRSGIFYIALDNLTQDEPGIHKPGDVVAIDQVVWDPASNTVLAKPAALLDQHRRYALVVTDAVTDSGGGAVTADPAFRGCLQGYTAYCGALAQALSGITVPLPGHSIVAASVFTTMSATAWLEHARAILSYVAPQVTLAQPQSTFRVADLAGIALHEQTGSNPVRFSDLSLPVTSTLLNGLDRVVIGSYQSPSFLESDQTIRPAPTRPDLNVPDQIATVGFNALLPSSPKPAAGYPVVIFGHGFGDSRFGGPTAVAPTLARAGLATIAINAVGHGFGPQSSVTFTDTKGNSVTVNALGRGLDLNGDGFIESEEGCPIVAPIAYGLRDCFRQTVVDLMQLARAIRQGIDLDGDGTPDLDGSRIYYAGDSLGSMYGTIFTAMEPAVRAAVLTVGGGSTADIVLWSPAYQSQGVQMLSQRIPALLNQGNTFNADSVMPQQPVHNLTVSGALAIQDVFETIDWLSNAGDPLAFAPHLKVSPLGNNAARPTLVQFARADRTMPNLATSNLVQNAGLQSTTWEYRHDLARAIAPDLPLDPHPYLELFVTLGGNTIQLPGLDGLAISLDAQGQLAGFLASDGKTVPDPNGLSKIFFGTSLFQIPATLPFDLGF